MHERFNQGDIFLKYELSDRMAADIYTKSFTDAEKWLSACWLINVVDPSLIHNCIQSVTYDEPNMDDIKQARDNQADDETFAACAMDIRAQRRSLFKRCKKHVKSL